jgi:hypothetical protein
VGAIQADTGRLCGYVMVVKAIFEQGRGEMMVVVLANKLEMEPMARRES